MANVHLPSPGIPLATIEANGERTIEELPPGEVMALYRQHGALLLRGFAADLDAFARFTRRLCPTAVKNESPGRVTIDQAGTIQSVNLGADAFPLHPELSREPLEAGHGLLYLHAATRSRRGDDGLRWGRPCRCAAR
ncbi:TauD/TfdA family dioxygenase [Novosphingobium sp. MW5]|nr:TauD/TfdA family dioxygenase [Novosphingobium sp. MW5]